MPGRPPVTIGSDAINLNTEAGLTDGETYNVQLASGSWVQYVNYATDPSGEEVGWNLLRSYEFFQIPDADSGNPTWVRAVRGKAQLVLSDA